MITIPNDEKFQNYEIKSDNNYKLYFNTIKHLNLQNGDIIEIDINRDWNCYYNNLSMLFTDIEEYNSLFRYTLYKYCSDFSLEIIHEFPHIDYYGKNYETKKYINLIKKDKFFVGV